MSNRREKKSTYNTINIYLTDASRDKVRLFKGTFSRTIRYAIELYYDSKFTLVKTYSLDSEKILYSVLTTTDWFRNDYCTQLYNSDSAIGCDMRTEGAHRFKTETIGAFSNKYDCVDFKDFLINKDMNDGVFVYNSEAFTDVVPRYMFAPIAISDYKKLTMICLDKKTTIEKVLESYIKKVINKFS